MTYDFHKSSQQGLYLVDFIDFYDILILVNNNYLLRSLKIEYHHSGAEKKLREVRQNIFEIETRSLNIEYVYRVSCCTGDLQ